MVNSLLTFVGGAGPDAGHQPAAGPGPGHAPAVPGRRPPIVSARSPSRAYTEARERVSAVNADLQENVAGMRVAQAYRREQVNSDRFAGLTGAYRVARLRAQRMIALYFPFVQALSTIGGAIILFAAAQRDPQRRADRRQPDRLPALGRPAVLPDPADVPGLRRLPAGQRRPAADQGPAAHADQHAASRPARSGRAGCAAGSSCGDVHFGYTGARTEAIGGVSLTIAPGETVALVGQTGAGKSTLVKLIARFYDVTSGRVLIDGTDVRDFDLPGYRQQLGVVPQESYLFAGTVRDAIAYGRPDASDAEVEAAARGVGAIDMIAAPARRIPPRGGRARPQPVGRAAPAHRPGPGLPGRPGDPAARRGHRGPGPGRRGRGQPGHRAAGAPGGPRSWSRTG